MHATPPIKKECPHCNGPLKVEQDTGFVAQCENKNCPGEIGYLRERVKYVEDLSARYARAVNQRRQQLAEATCPWRVGQDVTVRRGSKGAPLSAKISEIQHGGYTDWKVVCALCKADGTLGKRTMTIREDDSYDTIRGAPCLNQP